MTTTEPRPELRQTLYGFQVFFIVISTVIGSGIFINNGEALELSGPAGLIISVVVISIITIAVGECVGEFTQQFAAPNAIVEYVKTFVDEDLGWVIGLAYWYSFASAFALENLAAAALSEYWSLGQTLQIIAFYVISPIVILALNFCGVFYYGIVETIGGFLKCLLVLGVSILLYIIATKEGKVGTNGPINDGIQHNPNYASNAGVAVCYSIPLIAFAFYGVEVIAVTAYEAKYSTSVRWASTLTCYTIFSLYMLCTIGEALAVSWTDPYLPDISGGASNSTASTSTQPPRSVSFAINATLAAGYYELAGFLNGCFIFSVLSTSNSTLYVASRTLYGLARQIPDSNWIGKKINGLSLVVRQTGVPAAALFFSAVSFIWLPFLSLNGGYALEEVIEIMSVSASISCLIAWAALCLAFIRYERWLRICDDGLSEQHYQRFQRESPLYTPYTFFAWFQPWVAWIGFIGCLVVFVFVSATWWSTASSFTKVAEAYGAHFILLVVYIILKIINRRWWVTLSPDATVLITQLDRLEWLKQDQRNQAPAANGAVPPMSAVG